MEKNIEIYLDAVRYGEPFNALQIKAIKTVNGDCEWVDDSEAEYFGVYGRAEGDNLFYCIADCKTRNIAEELIDMLSTISRFTLTLITPKKEEEQSQDFFKGLEGSPFFTQG